MTVINDAMVPIKGIKDKNFELEKFRDLVMEQKHIFTAPRDSNLELMRVKAIEF